MSAQAYIKMHVLGGGYRVCEQLSTGSHHREGLGGLPQPWSPELTGRKRYRACDDGLRRGWSRVSRGSGWVRKELVDRARAPKALWVGFYSANSGCLRVMRGQCGCLGNTTCHLRATLDSQGGFRL